MVSATEFLFLQTRIYICAWIKRGLRQTRLVIVVARCPRSTRETASAQSARVRYSHIMSSLAHSAIASSLAALVPGFLKRMRNPDQDEARKLRAVLNAVGRSTVVDACMKLDAANEAHKQRLGGLEEAVAARNAAAEQETRAWVRDELAPYATAYAAAQPIVATTTTGAPAQAAVSTAAAATQPTERDRLLSMQPVEMHREASFVFAVSSHEPQAAEWRKGAASEYKSPNIVYSLPKEVFDFEPLVFWNLRATAIDALWIDFDGNDKRYRSSTVCACKDEALSSVLTRRSPQVNPGQMVTFSTRPRHAWRVYDAASGDFLGAALVRLVPDDMPSGYQDEHAGRQSLRAVFGFDGFIGPSLSDVLAAFEAADPTQAAVHQAVQAGFAEERYLVIVA